MNTWKDRWGEKGFTMAELLIVVAIIAVLAAVAIPIFTNQLEKSREGADADTIRNAYAKAAVVALEGKGFNDLGAENAKEGLIRQCVIEESDTGPSTIKVLTDEVPISQEMVSGWETAPISIAEARITSGMPVIKNASGKCYLMFTFTKYGQLRRIEAAESFLEPNASGGAQGWATIAEPGASDGSDSDNGGEPESTVPGGGTTTNP